MTSSGRACVVMGALIVSMPGGAASAQCTPAIATDTYLTEFSGFGRQALTFDDGSGPALYFAGSAPFIGQQRSSLPARWTGTTMVPLDSSVRGGVAGLAIFDSDGAGPGGPRLFAGGNLVLGSGEVTGLVMWDGSSLTPIGNFVDPVNGYRRVDSIVVHEDGQGARLYVTGPFASVDGVPAEGIAAWNGTSWSAVGPSATLAYSASINAMTSHTDSDGPGLFLVGTFSSIGGVSIPRGAARWDGISWSAFGADLNGSVRSITSVDTPSTGGRALVVTGTFTMAGSVQAPNIAIWQNGQWRSMGTQPAGVGLNPTAEKPGVLNIGDGPKVYARVNGSFSRWNGTSWDALVEGGGGVIGVDTTGPQRLIVAASQAGSQMMPGLAAFDGQTWMGFGGYGSGLDRSINTFAEGDLGEGKRIYATGSFSRDRDSLLASVASWDGSTWLASAAPISGVVYSSVVFDDGGGPALYVGGVGLQAGSTLIGHVARWNGTTWSRVGQPFPSPTNGSFPVRKLRVLDDGQGPRLYAVGSFGNPTTGPYAIMRLEGEEWLQVGTATLPSAFPDVNEICVFDSDGSGPLGPEIYVTNNDGVYSRIFVLRSGEWVVEPDILAVNHLQVYDDGSGAALYAFGPIRFGPMHIAAGAVRLRNGVWSQVGAVQAVDSQIPVTTCVFDDGSGPALFASGRLKLGEEYYNVVKWDGNSWLPIVPWVAGSLLRRDIAVSTYNGRPALFVAGPVSFSPTAGLLRTDGFSVYQGCHRTCIADFNLDGDVGTDADIEAFFACLAGNCCERCLTADFNGDGDFGTDADIESFFRVLAGGPC